MRKNAILLFAATAGAALLCLVSCQEKSLDDSSVIVPGAQVTFTATFEGTSGVPTKAGLATVQRSGAGQQQGYGAGTPSGTNNGGAVSGTPTPSGESVSPGSSPGSAHTPSGTPAGTASGNTPAALGTPAGTASGALPGTRTEVSGTRVLWSPGDRVSIFYGTGYAGGNVFTCDNEEPAASVNFTGILEELDGGTGKNFWAVSPYSDTNVGQNNAVMLTVPSEQEAPAGSFDRRAFYSVATSTDTHLRFYNVTGGLALLFDEPGITKVIIKGNKGEAVAGQVRVAMTSEGTPEIKAVLKPNDEIVLTAAEGSFTPGQMYFASMLPVEFAEGLSMEIFSNAGSTTKEITRSVTVKRSWFGRIPGVDAGVPRIATPEIVDLGLSVKWASFNLGATAPEESGDYYAWGETEPYYEPGTAHNDPPTWKEGKEDGYIWSSYKWAEGSSTDWDDVTAILKYNTDSSYGEVDGKTELDPEDDAATVNLGDLWRMPTADELQELVDYCEWTETTVNGVLGMLATSKIEGYTDKSIFFPYAQGWNGAEYLEPKYYTGTYLWSSDIGYSSLGAKTLEVIYLWETNIYRCCGLSVRPVYGERKTINGHKFVEMGDGLKWATCNVGAEKPEDYGDYYAWGETEPKEGYSWATYKWMQEGQSAWKYITKYTFADSQTGGIWYDSGGNFIGDDKTSLKDYDYEDDAARQNWKSTWRTPTDAEWTWLRENCTWTWTTQNGVNGRLVTAKNGNSIFLPAAGYRDGTDLDGAGSLGNYWSSSLDESYSDYVRLVYFSSGGVGRDGSRDRCYGLSVRPVSE